MEGFKMCKEFLLRKIHVMGLLGSDTWLMLVTWWDGASYSEIAEGFEVDRQTVKRRIDNALKILESKGTPVPQRHTPAKVYNLTDSKVDLKTYAAPVA